MALLFMDGFDADDTPLKWANANGTSSATGTRFGTGRAAGISNTAFTRTFTPSNEIFAGVAVHISNLDASIAVRPYITLSGDNGATTHLSIGYSYSTLEVRRGTLSGTLLATYLYAFNPGTWYHLEISASIADTGGTCVVKLNGATVINFTGDTKNGGTNTTIDKIGLGSNGGYTAYFDDVYVADSTGPAPYNTFLGDVRIYSLTPNGTGSTTQFTPSSGANYTAVDELPYSATDYVSTNTIGNRDTYAMADLPASAANVLAVQVNVVAKKADAYPVSLRPAIMSGTNVYYGTTKTLGTADTTLQDLHIIDPATSSAWTVNGVNSIEAGMETA